MPAPIQPAPTLTPALQQRLLDLLAALVDQEHARVLVPPNAAQPGFWFGGGGWGTGGGGGGDDFGGGFGGGGGDFGGGGASGDW